ncbi:hypothetical protein RVR_2764 [Actinacidiphila reveromycinica]|uniref:DUF742 domain-containing protein n=1 Tax=Actinacidiphila reveromycinica TaxID=659352 RepID=A0A7U3UR22_9ACTN|nr:DUF742 domain-containing protein [Streptomyces sp. SN-593]BBA97150.1 hypothetical protein RVR_2764 [Streptomyces sp. SN-593]
MSRESVEGENPDRLYTLTGGRSRADDTRLDLVALIVSESQPAAGMQSEHAAILRICRRPTAVVELSADLRLPVSVVRILLADLLDTGKVTARHPRTPKGAGLPDSALLKQVLVGLRKL